MSSPPLPLQRPLNLILPVRREAQGLLGGLLMGLNQQVPNPLHVALAELSNVHFAQFVLLEMPPPRLADAPPIDSSEAPTHSLLVLTIYDADFDDYIVSFVERVGPLFDRILAHVHGAAGLIPVAEHREAFIEFIRQHNHEMPLFSAYPGQRVFDIKDALELP